MDLSTISEREEYNLDSSAILDNAPDSGHDQFPADETQTDDYASHDIDNTYNSKYETERADSEPASMEVIASEQGQEHDTARPKTPDSRLPQKHATPPSPEPTPRTSRRFDIEQKRGYHRKNRPKTAVTYLKDADIIAPFAPVRKVVVEEKEEDKEEGEEEEEGRLLDEGRAFYLTRLRHGNEAGPPLARGEKSLLNPSSQRRFSKSPRRLHSSKEASTANADENQEDAPTSNFSSSSSEGEIESDSEDDKQLPNDETQGATEELRSASIDAHGQFSSESIITQSSTPVDGVSSTASGEPEDPPPTSSVSNSEGFLEDGTPRRGTIDTNEAGQPSTNGLSSCTDTSSTPASVEPLPAQQPPSTESSNQTIVEAPETARKDPEQELVELEKLTGLSRVEGLAIQKRFYSLDIPDEDSSEPLAMQRTQLNFERDARAHEEERCGETSPFKSPPLPEDPDTQLLFWRSVGFRLLEERDDAYKILDMTWMLVRNLENELQDQDKPELVIHDPSERERELQERLFTSKKIHADLKEEANKLRYQCGSMKQEYKENIVRLTENDNKREERVQKLNKFIDELQDRCEVLESENKGHQKRAGELGRELQEAKDELQKTQDEVQEALARLQDSEIRVENEANENQDELQEVRDELQAVRDELQETQDELHRFQHTVMAAEPLFGETTGDLEELEQKLQQERSEFQNALREKDKQLERLGLESREWQTKLQQESSKLRKALQEKDELKLLQQNSSMAQSSIAASGSVNRTSPSPPSVGDDSVSTPITSVSRERPCEQPKLSFLAENKHWQERISSWRRGGEWQEMREALRRQREEENRQDEAAVRT